MSIYLTSSLFWRIEVASRFLQLQVILQNKTGIQAKYDFNGNSLLKIKDNIVLKNKIFQNCNGLTNRGGCLQFRGSISSDLLNK